MANSKSKAQAATKPKTKKPAEAKTPATAVAAKAPVKRKTPAKAKHEEKAPARKKAQTREKEEAKEPARTRTKKSSEKPRAQSRAESHKERDQITAEELVLGEDHLHSWIQRGSFGARAAAELERNPGYVKLVLANLQALMDSNKEVKDAFLSTSKNSSEITLAYAQVLMRAMECAESDAERLKIAKLAAQSSEEAAKSQERQFSETLATMGRTNKLGIIALSLTLVGALCLGFASYRNDPPRQIR